MEDVYEIPDSQRRFLTDRVPLFRDGEPGQHSVKNIRVVPVSTNQGKTFVVAFTLVWKQSQWWDQTWVVVMATDSRFRSPRLLFETPYDDFAELIDAVTVDDEQACVLLYSTVAKIDIGPGRKVSYRVQKLEANGFLHPPVAFLDGGIPSRPEFDPTVYKPLALGGVFQGRQDPIVLAIEDAGEFGDGQALIAIRLRADDLTPRDSREIDRAPEITEVALSRGTEPRTNDSDNAGWIGAFRIGDVVRWFLVRPFLGGGLNEVSGAISIGHDISDLQVDGGRYEVDPSNGLIVYRFCVSYVTKVDGIRRLESHCAVFRGVRGILDQTTVYGPSQGPVALAFDTHSQCHWMLVDQGDFAESHQAMEGVRSALVNPTNVRRLGATGTAYTARRRAYFDTFDVAFDHRYVRRESEGFVTAFVRHQSNDKRVICLDNFRNSHFSQAYRTQFTGCPRIRPFGSQYVVQLESVPLAGHARFRVQLMDGPTDGRVVWLRVGSRMLGDVPPCDPMIDMTAPGSIAIQAEPDETGFAELDLQLSEVLMPDLFRKNQHSYEKRGEILDYPNLLFAQWVWFTPTARVTFPRDFSFDPVPFRPSNERIRTTIEINLSASNVHWIFVNE